MNFFEKNGNYSFTDTGNYFLKEKTRSPEVYISDSAGTDV